MKREERQGDWATGRQDDWAKRRKGLVNEGTIVRLHEGV